MISDACPQRKHEQVTRKKPKANYTNTLHVDREDGVYPRPRAQT